MALGISGNSIGTTLLNLTQGLGGVVTTDALLLEIGDYLLLETGDKLLLES